MNRRTFVRVAGGAIAVVPFGPLQVRAQTGAMPLIGFLRSAPLDGAGLIVAAFREGLKETGYTEGHNVVLELRSAENRLDRLPAIIDELLRRRVAVIVANTPAALAAKAATRTVPIVFAGGADPVREGLVRSLNKPGANVTGVTFLSSELAAKRLELIRELAPKATKVAVLIDKNNPDAVAAHGSVQTAARTHGLSVIALNASNDTELDQAFAAIEAHRADGMLVFGAFPLSRRDKVTALAARYRVAAVYPSLEYAAAGGLMSYGSSITDAYRLAGVLAGKILKGARPADLPVQRAAKVELIINLKAAKALGVTIPGTLIVRADRVIE